MNLPQTVMLKERHKGWQKAQPARNVKPGFNLDKQVVSIPTTHYPFSNH